MPTKKPQSIYRKTRVTTGDELTTIQTGLARVHIDPMCKGEGTPKPVPAAIGESTGPCNQFDEMGLKPELLKGIKSYGLKKPAHIQELAIMPGTTGRDLILQAQSGMGKTAAMAIITLQRIQPENPACQTMILVPTRELALQVRQVFVELSKFMNIKSAVYIGGSGKSKKEHAALGRGGIHVMIGTLGRLANIVREKMIDPLALKIFVMDEADKMLLDDSYKNDLLAIVSDISENAQVILMSATMPDRALRYAKEITVKPKIFLIPKFQLTLEGITQFYVNVGNKDSTKLETLHELLPTLARYSKQTLVFCNTRNRVRVLCQQLINRGHSVGSIEGKQLQSNRISTLQKFRRHELHALIASDLLGRGIDVEQMFVVVNYDMVDLIRIEEYIHRVGRAGRYGRKGLAITFVDSMQEKRASVHSLESFYHTKIEEMPANIEDFLG